MMLEEAEITDLEKGHSSNDNLSHSSNTSDGRPGRMTEPIRTTSRKVERPETLQRTNTSSTLQRAQSVLSTVRSRKPIGPFNHPLTHEKTTTDVIVDFDGPDDPYRPINWPFRKKAITTALYGFTTMGVTFASSVFSPAVDQVAAEFNVGTEVSTLGVALLLFGFGIGPLIWAPLSEVYGRKPAVLIPYFVSTMFIFGSGAAENIQTLCITRFFAGVFGSAPITNTGGVLGDIWDAKSRGVAIVFYAAAVVGGPTLGPICGGALVDSYLQWRWTSYITGIFMMTVLVLDILILDESYPNALLVTKARRLRHESGNWALHARHEEWDPSLSELSKKYLVRPFQLLMTPICFLVALYASFVYGILYGFLAAFPVEFQELRGWNPLVGSLPFLALLLGIIIGGIGNVFNQKFYYSRLVKNDFKPVPEARLPPMMFGSIFFAGGLFLFAWTSSPHIFWLCPCIGAVLIGIGFFTIFQSALNYLIDTFQQVSASAIAANTFLRSCFAGAFPLFMTPLLHNIGVDWGITIFACIAVLLIPIPYLFFIYGRSIRARGYWSKASCQ